MCTHSEVLVELYFPKQYRHGRITSTTTLFDSTSDGRSDSVLEVKVGEDELKLEAALVDEKFAIVNSLV